MIYTVTFNPSIDYVVKLGQLQEGELNRVQEEQFYPGGKGLNVSFVLKQLGKESAAWGFVAGFTGNEIVRCLEQEGVFCDFIQLEQGFSRINVKLKTGVESEINGVGPRIKQNHIQSLLLKLEQIQPQDIVVLAGSVPRMVPLSIYGEICSRVRERGGNTVVDAAGELLKQSLAHHPFLIKPNVAELEELFGISIEGEEQLVKYGKSLLEMGAQMVLISRGAEGALLITKERVYKQKAPKGIVKNSVGAGDSMVAGFLTGWLDSMDLEEALRLGVAAGSASAFSEGLASRQQVEAVRCRIF